MVWRRLSRHIKDEGFEFKYNSRLSLLLIPCAALTMIMGGTGLMSLVTVGLIITYILDATGIREGPFLFLWLVALASVCYLTFFSGGSLAKSSTSSLFLLCNLNSFIILVAVWMSLHCKWFVDSFPTFAARFERLLLSSLCMPCSNIIMTGCISLLGSGKAHFYFLPILYLAYRVTITPLAPSSHHTHKTTPHDRRRKLEQFHPSVALREEVDTYIVGAATSVAHTLALLVSPFLYYVAVHHRTLFTSIGLANAALMAALPWLLLSTLIQHDILWWTGLSFSRATQLHPKLVGASLFVLTGCVEYRVVLHSFSPYLYYHTTSPFLSQALVSAAMYSALVAGLLAWKGWEQRARAASSASATLRQFVFKACIHISAVTAAAAVGVPSHLLPCVLVASFTATVFYFSRQFYLYLLFVAAFTVAVGWFIHHTFWFLSVDFVEGISLHQLCLALSALFLIALFIPGLTLITISPSIVDALLALYGCFFALAEFLLYHQNGRYESDVYSFYFVLLTSAMGVYLAQVLHHRQNKLSSPFFYWLVLSVFIGKAGMLVCTSLYTLAHWLALVACALSMYALYAKSAAASSSMTSSSAHSSSALDSHNSHKHSESSNTIRRAHLSYGPASHDYTSSLQSPYGMSTKGALMHALSIICVLAMIKDTIITDALRFFSPFPPTSTDITAVILISACVGFLPLSFYHFHHIPVLRRTNTIALVIAFLFIAIKPDVTGGGGLRSMAVGREYLFSSFQIYSVGVHDQATPVWPGWVLFGSLSLLIVAITSFLPMPRVLFGIVMGTSVSLYMCELYLPYHFIIYALFIAIFSLTSVVLVYLYWRSAYSDRMIVLAFGLFIALFPVTYMVAGHLFSYSPRNKTDGSDLLETVRITLLYVYTALSFIIAFCCNIAMEDSLSLSSSSSSSLSSSSSSAGAYSSSPALRGPSSVFSSSSSSSFGTAHQRSRTFAKALPSEAYVGNIAAPLALVLGLVLNIQHMNGSITSIVFLAPILLLLNQDHGALRGLTEERRYYPLILVISGCLFASSCIQIVVEPTMMQLNLSSSSTGHFSGRETFSFFDWITQCVLLLCVVPSQSSFLRFLWYMNRQNDFLLLCVAPLNIIPLVLSSLVELQILGAIGLAGGCFQLYSSHIIRKHGMKVI